MVSHLMVSLLFLKKTSKTPSFLSPEKRPYIQEYLTPYFSLSFFPEQESALVTYHSRYNDETDAQDCCGIPLLELDDERTTYNAEVKDIVDEAIHLYRANILFKSFKVQGGADRILVYLTCYIQFLLQTLQ